MTSKTNNKYLHSFFLIGLASLTLCLPQIISGKMILGSDSIFHFNRFYDTSQQFKNLDFHYFISLYGFQESGRIVNALYGPFFAYFQGILVLISRNWFTYQLFSNFCLYNLAGFSMYIFLTKAKLEREYTLIGAILYLSTYSIQYWIIRQGFTSWGAALLPLALSILFKFYQTKKIPRWYLGILTALVSQIHMLSAFILILMYIPFFIYMFLKNNKKIVFLKDLFIEICLFFCLTLNIWGSYFIVLKGNRLIPPIVNINMSLNTINQNSYYWLLNPAILFFMLVAIYHIFFLKWKRINNSEIKIWFWVMTVFLVLSSSLIPWSYLVKIKNPFAELIQYPFRFFVPVSIIIIYLFLKLVQSKQLLKYHKKMLLISFLALSLLQTLTLVTITTNNWDSSSNFMPSKYKVHFLSDSANIKKSFYDANKEKALNMVAKGTPDYLPLYGEKDENINYYDMYLEKIVYQKKIKKSIKDGKLIIEWTANADKEVELPIIVYKNTILEINEKIIPHDQISLSQIGTLKISQIPYKENRITLSYKIPREFTIFLVITFLTWLLIVVILLKKMIIYLRS
ncbi:hypothetical protein [Streptococcus suis]|uniref:hypothetical protein n=1 Tax=Streptococcus suis TaxID=1307 RepID=UPI001F37F7D0|nr:hypothetical protein [Streptococcus suis]